MIQHARVALTGVAEEAGSRFCAKEPTILHSTLVQLAMQSSEILLVVRVQGLGSGDLGRQGVFGTADCRFREEGFGFDLSSQMRVKAHRSPVDFWHSSLVHFSMLSYSMPHYTMQFPTYCA